MPDHHYSTLYVATAYRLPVWNLEPLLYKEISHRPASLGDTGLILGTGLNVLFSPVVQLKNMVALFILEDAVNHSECTDSTDYCAVSLCAASGYCAMSDCVDEDSACPDGWRCFGLSGFGANLSLCAETP